jgi:hypothetical protein
MDCPPNASSAKEPADGSQIAIKMLLNLSDLVIPQLVDLISLMEFNGSGRLKALKTHQELSWLPTLPY